MKTYACHNSACVLGSRAHPGKFTGGITAEQVTLMTGRPTDSLKRGVDYGPGFCPNCGELGEEHDAKAEARASLDEQIAALEAQKARL